MKLIKISDIDKDNFPLCQGGVRRGLSTVNKRKLKLLHLRPRELKRYHRWAFFDF